MNYFLSPKYYGQIVMKSNQTLQLTWREQNEKEGENKNTKCEKKVIRARKKQCNVGSRMD